MTGAPDSGSTPELNDHSIASKSAVSGPEHDSGDDKYSDDEFAGDGGEPPVKDDSADEYARDVDDDEVITLKSQRDVRDTDKANRQARLRNMVSAKADFVAKGLFGNRHASGASAGTLTTHPKGARCAPRRGSALNRLAAPVRSLVQLSQLPQSGGAAVARGANTNEATRRRLAVGVTVTLHGLKKKPELNGSEGVIVDDPHKECGNYVVLCEVDNRERRFRPSNLVPHAAPFASADDEKNCVFRPRRTLKAKMAAEKAKSGESRAGAGDVASRCYARAADSERKLEEKRAEEAYATRLDKKVCPKCGTEQAYKEVKDRKRGKRCQNDACKGADGKGPLFAPASAWGAVADGFLQRMESNEAKLRDSKAQIVEHVERIEKRGTKQPKSLLQRALDDKLGQRGGQGSVAFMRRMEEDQARRRKKQADRTESERDDGKGEYGPVSRTAHAPPSSSTLPTSAQRAYAHRFRLLQTIFPRSSAATGAAQPMLAREVRSRLNEINLEIVARTTNLRLSQNDIDALILKADVGGCCKIAKAAFEKVVLETYGPQTWEERSESTTWPTPVNNASVVGTAGRAARRGSTGNIFALQVVYCRKHGKPVVVPQSVWAEGGAPTTIGELRSRLWAKRGTFGFPPTKLIALHADMHSTSRLHDDVPIGSTIVQQHDGAKVVFVLER